MSDYFSEYIVKRRTPMKEKYIRVLLVALCVVSLVLLWVPYIGFIVTVALIALTWIYFRNTDVEWEYTLVEKSMSVDKIMSKAKRKRMVEFDLTKIELVAPEDSDDAKNYNRNNLKVMDYSSMEPENKKYIMVISQNNEMVKVIFEPSERMLKEMRDVAPRQVHMQ